MRKGTTEYVDERSRKTQVYTTCFVLNNFVFLKWNANYAMLSGYGKQEDVSETMVEPTQGTWNPGSLGPLPPEIIALANRNWKMAVGGPNKGRLYGSGPLAPLLDSGVDHFDTSGPSGSGPPPPPPATADETAQLRQQVQAQAQVIQDQEQRLQTHEQVQTTLQEDFLNFTRAQAKILKYYNRKHPNGSESEGSDDNPY